MKKNLTCHILKWVCCIVGQIGLQDFKLAYNFSFFFCKKSKVRFLTFCKIYIFKFTNFDYLVENIYVEKYGLYLLHRLLFVGCICIRKILILCFFFLNRVIKCKIFVTKFRLFTYQSEKISYTSQNP